MGAFRLLPLPLMPSGASAAADTCAPVSMLEEWDEDVAQCPLAVGTMADGCDYPTGQMNLIGHWELEACARPDEEATGAHRTGGEVSRLPHPRSHSPIQLYTPCPRSTGVRGEWMHLDVWGQGPSTPGAVSIGRKIKGRGDVRGMAGQ